MNWKQTPANQFLSRKLESKKHFTADGSSLPTLLAVQSYDKIELVPPVTGDDKLWRLTLKGSTAFV